MHYNVGIVVKYLSQQMILKLPPKSRQIAAALVQTVRELDHKIKIMYLAYFI